MKLFRSIDKRFEDLGFKKIVNDVRQVVYKRERVIKDIHTPVVTHAIYINYDEVRKCYTVTSCCEDFADVPTSIEMDLSVEEMKLCLKKIKKMDKKRRRNRI